MVTSCHTLHIAFTPVREGGIYYTYNILYRGREEKNTGCGENGGDSQGRIQKKKMRGKNQCNVDENYSGFIELYVAVRYAHG